MENAGSIPLRQWSKEEAAVANFNQTAMDRLSSLPDGILHRILLRLGSVPAAARTSVLSSHWRRIWTHLPEFILCDFGPARTDSFLNAVDGVIAGHSGQALLALAVSMFNVPTRVPAARVAPWLRFAAQNVAGDFFLCLPWHPESPDDEEVIEEDLEVPLCVRTISIQLSVGHGYRYLRLPWTGTFTVLKILRIQQARIETPHLERLVSLQCPCLIELQLIEVRHQLSMADIAIRSASLKRLYFDVKNVRRLVLDTPLIVELSLSMVEKVSVPTIPYNNTTPVGNCRRASGLADCQQLVPAAAMVGRHLRRLNVNGTPQVMLVLMRHFNTIGEMQLDLHVAPGEGYKSFLRSTTKLASCDVLVLKLTANWHALASSVLHLLRKSVGLRKLVVYLPWIEGSRCTPGCPCGRRGSLRTADIAVDSLEVIEIHDFRGAEHQLGILKLLRSCKNTAPRSIDIYISWWLRPPSDQICQSIRNGAHPRTVIKFYTRLQGNWVPYLPPNRVVIPQMRAAM